MIVAWLSLASTAHAAAIVSIPTDGPALTHVGQQFLVPVRIDGFTNPTGQGGQSVECNIVASQGLTIQPNLFIGPWTISGNPTQYYGVHDYYVDLFQRVGSFINVLPPCIVADSGVAFSLRVIVNQYWYGGHETLRLGKSVKETGVEPRLADCAGTIVPTAYGNKTCVFPPAVLGVAMDTPRATAVEWYDVAGRKLATRPTGSGIYFQGAAGIAPRKVVVIR
jgi:hypothetical protein